jgi:hypothetical protein
LFSTLNVALGDNDKVETARVSHPNGTTLVERLIQSPKMITVYDDNRKDSQATPKKPHYWNNWREGYNVAQNPAIGADVDVNWNLDADSKTSTHDTVTDVTKKKDTPDQIVLGHELIHADRFSRGQGKVMNMEQNTYDEGTYKKGKLNQQGEEVGIEKKEEIYTVGLRPYPEQYTHKTIANPLFGTNAEEKEYPVTPGNPDETAITENDLRNEQALEARTAYP